MSKSPCILYLNPWVTKNKNIRSKPTKKCFLDKVDLHNIFIESALPDKSIIKQ